MYCCSSIHLIPTYEKYHLVCQKKTYTDEVFFVYSSPVYPTRTGTYPRVVIRSTVTFYTCRISFQEKYNTCL